MILLVDWEFSWTSAGAFAHLIWSLLKLSLLLLPYCTIYLNLEHHICVMKHVTPCFILTGIYMLEKHGKPLGLYTKLWCFSHSRCVLQWDMGQGCAKKIFFNLFMVMWNKGFEELGLIIFSKEYLGKLNIMKLICLELSMQRYLYSSLKSQVRRAIGWEWNLGLATFKE